MSRPKQLTTPTTSSSLQDALPPDPIGQWLCSIFWYLWYFIYANLPDSPDIPVEWTTETGYPLRPRALWEYWQTAGYLIGVRFTTLTFYALIDIDRHSPYHPAQDATAIPRLLAALEDMGIHRVVIVRSSYSGGLHIYLPFPEKVRTFQLASALRHCITSAGFKVAQGHLEIFPNCKHYAKPGEKSHYNGHRLPLLPQSGSLLLDDDFQPLQSGATSLARLKELWEWASAGQDLDTLLMHLTLAKESNYYRRGRTKKQLARWETELLATIAGGWTKPGDTNDLLRLFACYGIVFKKLQGQALIEFMMATAIAAPGYAQYCRHQHQIHQRCKDWAKCAQKYYWPKGSEPIVRQIDLYAANNIVPLHPNAQRAQDAQARISAALKAALEQGTLPSGYTARLHYLVQAAQTSPNTLVKYKSIWYPNAEEQPITPEPEMVLAVAEPEPGGCGRSLDPAPKAALQPIPLNERYVTDGGLAESSGSPPTGRPGWSEICADAAVEASAEADCGDFEGAIAAVENPVVEDAAIAHSGNASSEPNAPGNATGESDIDLSLLMVPELSSGTEAQLQAIADPASPETVTPTVSPNAGVPEAIAHSPPVTEALSNRDSDAWISWSYYQQAIRAECDRLQLDAEEWATLLRHFNTRLLTALSPPQMQQLLETLRQIPDF